MGYGIVKRRDGFRIKQDGYCLTINDLPANNKTYQYSYDIRYTIYRDDYGSSDVFIYSSYEGAQAKINELNARDRRKLELEQKLRENRLKELNAERAARRGLYGWLTRLFFGVSK